MSKTGGSTSQAALLLAIQAQVGAIPITPELEAAALARYNAIDALIDLVKAQTDKTVNIEHTRPYVIPEVEFDDVALVGPTNLSTLSITPTFPVGSTKVKAYLLAHLFISNQTATAQNITPSISAQVNGGGFNSIWAPGDIMVSVPATIGTSTMLIAECDISAYFVTAQITDLYFIVTQTGANSVHYTSQATIFLVYTV